jgi:hypothetical protein
METAVVTLERPVASTRRFLPAWLADLYARLVTQRQAHADARITQILKDLGLEPHKRSTGGTKRLPDSTA